jgi:signal transduction protein with GAF and PtsI domain
MCTTREPLGRPRAAASPERKQLKRSGAIGIIDAVAATVGCRRPRVGAMLETPSALFEIDDILSLVDFASWGTNDLTQFMLGADRRTAEYLSDDAILQRSTLAFQHCKRAG